jgi:hypothetical protein
MIEQLSLLDWQPPPELMQQPTQAPPIKLGNSCSVSVGSRVRLAQPLAAHIYQEGNPPIGTVTFIEPSGNLHVKFSDTRSCYPPSQLEPADSPNLQPPNPDTIPNQPHPSLTAGAIAWLQSGVEFYEAGAARFIALAYQVAPDHPKRRSRLHEAKRCQELANQARQKLIGGEYAATT